MKRNNIGRSYAGKTLDFDLDDTHVIDLPLKEGKPYAEVMFMGDLHIGHTEWSEGHFKRYLKLLEEHKNIRVVGMGDYIEAEDLSNYLPDTEIRTKEQIKLFYKYFEPIKDQLLALLYGNHEERIQRATKNVIDLLELLCLKLGKSDIVRGRPQKGILLVFKVGEQIYPVYVLHSSTGAIIHADTQLRRSSLNWLVTLIVHAHNHAKGWYKPRTFFTLTIVDGKPMRAVMRQYWLSSGTFLRYAGYAEKKSYPVTDIGAPIVRFYSNIEALEYVDPLEHREYQKYFIDEPLFCEPYKIPQDIKETATKEQKEEQPSNVKERSEEEKEEIYKVKGVMVDRVE